MNKQDITINKINYYITRIIELKNAKYHDYTKTIEIYKNKIIEELKDL